MQPLSLLNSQPPEKPDRRDDGSLEVHSIFYTIQGEGPFAGTPAVFVRLAGCSESCPSCDTEYTSIRDRMSVEAICGEVDRRGPSGGNKLVVLTGGEPFRQNTGPLVAWLIGAGYRVQVETNGYHAPGWDRDLARPSEDTSEVLSVVCSPKAPKVHPELLPWIDAYKYVLDADHVDPSDGLPTAVLGLPCPPARPHPGFRGEVFLQPADERDPARNARNRQAVAESCLRYGYRLSVQTHKLFGLD